MIQLVKTIKALSDVFIHYPYIEVIFVPAINSVTTKT